MPDPRYFSMPSIDDGAELRRKRALNCWPWVRSLTHSPDAVIHSPAATMAAWPTTVTRSRWPRALTLRTQNPLSGLWKVTRSTSPARTSRSADPGCRSSRDFTMSRARERSATSSRTGIVASARPPLHGSSKSSSPRETASMLLLCSATISKPGRFSTAEPADPRHGWPSRTSRCTRSGVSRERSVPRTASSMPL